MSRRRTLGHIDPSALVTAGIKTKISDAKLTKIDLLGDIPNLVLTQVSELQFDGSVMKPSGIHISGSGNQFKMQGTDTTGTTKQFVLSITGSVLRLDPL